MVLETDSPFLPPQPWRGRNCRPEMVVETARVLADLKQISLADLALATSANAARVYRMPPLDVV